MLTREQIQQKRMEYEDAYMQHLNTANANHGAMQAMDELLAIVDKEAKEIAPSPTPKKKGAGKLAPKGK